jgi:hypothetical protein
MSSVKFCFGDGARSSEKMIWVFCVVFVFERLIWIAREVSVREKPACSPSWRSGRNSGEIFLFLEGKIK